MSRNRLSNILCLTLLASGLAIVTAARAAPPLMCALPPFDNIPAPASNPGDTTLTLQADQALVTQQGLSKFAGDVVAIEGDKRLRADLALYNSDKRAIFASGNVLFASPTLEVKGRRGHYFLTNDLGQFFDAHFRLPSRHGRGQAEKVELTGPGTSRLDDVLYTTCPPGRKDWALKAPRINLNRDTDIGTAYNATIRFYGVPLFYTPYISFPLSDRRKSGFLTPVPGYSQGNGFDLKVPYYLNIAPNLDLTLAPRILSRRGVLINTQTRYLLPGTGGELGFSILPYDRRAHRQRRRVHFRDRTTINEHWDLGVDLNHVSDAEYFADFGNSLEEAAQRRQLSNLQLSYNDASWSYLTRLRSYQTLNAFGVVARPPYRELPQMLLDWRPPPNNYRLDYGASSELVRFSYPGRVGAARLHVRPHVDYTFGSHAAYLRPAARIDSTAYQLYNLNDADRPTSLSRTAPILSLDSGLVFERDAFGGLIETLEPRLFYLYVPYHDQHNIPIFDTHNTTFNYFQLFNTNRFNGIDRLGDANHLSYGLTTRFIDSASGKELLSASVGQIYYLEDRRVTQPGASPDTRSRSNVIGELRFNLNDRWSANATLQWNTFERRNDVAAFQVQYRHSPRQVINVGYRFRRNRLKETDVSFAWPIARHWQVVGRWNYSLKDHEVRETFAGFQYENCCWAFTLVDRRYLRPNQEIATSYYLQLQFKGLGRLGRNVRDFLQRGILGYGD